MAPPPKRKPLPAFNGVSIAKIEIEQDGDLHVEFDLPTPVDQQSINHRTDIVAKRTFDVYRDKELMAASRTLFRILRERIQQVDADRAVINCMTCQESRCCREYDVFVEAEDVGRLAAHFKTTEAAIAKKYLDEKPDWTGDYKYRLRKVKDDVGDLCSFLKRDKKSGQMRCSVYGARPNLCRTFDERDCTLYDDNGRML